MSLYGDYIKEREKKDILEKEDGYATYIINGEECYVEDVYVRPEKRKQGYASQLVDEITVLAKERGCKYVTTTVRPSTEGSTVSTIAILRYGFRLHSSQIDGIVFIKEIQ